MSTSLSRYLRVPQRESAVLARPYPLPVGRIAEGRRRLNRWADGPAQPNHDSLDIEHLFKYFERRALVFVIVALLLWQGLVALTLHLLWPRAPLGILLSVSAICVFWPVAWRWYLQHHYKVQFRTAEPAHRSAPSGPGASDSPAG